MHPIAATHDWIVAHPIAVMFILFVASTVISLYGNSIRNFLRVWPLRTHRVINHNANLKRLQTLEYLHNNPYRLVLFLSITLLGSVRSIVWWCILITVFYVVVFHTPSSIPFWGVVGGVGFSILQQTLYLLDDLLHFDESTVRLRKAIAKDEAKLALKRPSD